jgi:glyoxylase-like metal-dependent hydrolase (beta-lactamase superfamily II)
MPASVAPAMVSICLLETRSVDEIVAKLTAGELERGVPRGYPHSRILASVEEIARTAGIGGAMLGYLPQRWPKWFAPEPLAWQPSRYGPFARSARISVAGDVIAVPTPGHTPSHLSVIVRDGDDEIMLAGDTSYLESTMLSGTVDGVSPDARSADSFHHQHATRMGELCDIQEW